MLMFVFCTGFLNFLEYMIIIVYFDFKLQVDTASCRLVAASRGGSNKLRQSKSTTGGRFQRGKQDTETPWIPYGWIGAHPEKTESG